MHIRSAAIRCNRLPARSAAIRCAPPLQLSAQIRCSSAPYGPAHGFSPSVSPATSAQIRCNPRIPLHGLPQSVAPRVMPSARNVCLNPLQQLHADAVRPQNRPAVYTPRGLCPRDPRQGDIAPLHAPLRACAALGPGDRRAGHIAPLHAPPRACAKLGPGERRGGRLSDGVPTVRGCRGRHCVPPPQSSRTVSASRRPRALPRPPLVSAASSGSLCPFGAIGPLGRRFPPEPCRGPGQRPGGPPAGVRGSAPGSGGGLHAVQ